ncbi:uncharacterized protein LTR77_008682 [Saxophila tyrrhenica]|uniref:Sugar phosphate transporter domain-containing protein n=1 Tax=Saxophila tyrrhenica TaxID=1690608 RepID=A0AAV9P0M3_9PEZI|nr:hypothetical protein LTR77_008682 [Saxophila tyrrhenica]
MGSGGRNSGESERKLEGGVSEKQLPAPAQAQAPKGDGGLHPAVFIALWIALSSSVILFNKWILSSAKFIYKHDDIATALAYEFQALFLTTWHMVFAALMTQILARATPYLDSRHKVPMTPQKYMSAIVPIGIMFSLSLIFGNVAYMYLSVSFIQMLKASNAVATLLATWVFGLAPPSMRTFANVSAIVVGVAIASWGEIKFDLTGFLFQAAGIVFEATRLVMVQRLLSSAEFKMDPMVSLYYFAPACAVINGVFTLFVEAPKMSMLDIYSLGFGTLIANAFVAFGLNVAVVLLIGKTSAVVLTLSGVLKDILLVIASMAIFKDPVAPTQWFGYSIALGGLMYYKLGGEKLRSLGTDTRLAVGGFQQEHPMASKALVLLAVVGSIAFLVLEVWPAVMA